MLLHTFVIFIYTLPVYCINNFHFFFFRFVAFVLVSSFSSFVCCSPVSRSLMLATFFFLLPISVRFCDILHVNLCRTYEPIEWNVWLLIVFIIFGFILQQKKTISMNIWQNMIDLMECFFFYFWQFQLSQSAFACNVFFILCTCNRCQKCSALWLYTSKRNEKLTH